MTIIMFDATEEDKDELMEELHYRIDMYGLDYADTFRATPVENGAEEHAKKVSCCGVFEHKHTCRSGHTYYIGCNYGH